jgi:hypothetical protein
MIQAHSGPKALPFTFYGPYKSPYHNGAADFLFDLWKADYDIRSDTTRQLPRLDGATSIFVYCTQATAIHFAIPNGTS